MTSNRLWVPTILSLVYFSESDELIPNVHYILLKDDFSDLEEQFEWTKSHPTECQKIIKNVNKYMEQFMDKENEDKLQK